ncbi:hypothetical protein BH09CHL1_BH09CHL1_17990 [soil metagenome]
MGFDTISGLPAHPLVVHIPVVGIPLVALLMVIYVFVPSKRPGLFWPTSIGIVFVTLATIVAASTGESLEESLPRDDRSSALLHRHTELGDQTQTIVIIFAIAALGFLALDWWKRTYRDPSTAPKFLSGLTAKLTNPSVTRLVLGLGVVAVLLGGVATVWDVRTGHAGAKSAWNDVSSESAAGD